MESIESTQDRNRQQISAVVLLYDMHPVRLLFGYGYLAIYAIDDTDEVETF